jgi:hypothetical protein
MTDRALPLRSHDVQALLAGRKTQHRLLVPRNKAHLAREAGWQAMQRASDREWIFLAADSVGWVDCGVLHRAGDRLWVQEGTTRFDKGTCDQWVWYRAGGNKDEDSHSPFRFSGLGADDEWPKGKPGPAGGVPYNVAATQMPRWASRFTITIKDVRVQRLQAISREDVIAEGVTERDGAPIEDVWAGWHEPYATWWEARQGKGAWDADPWVIALTFRVERRNIDDAAERDAA